MTAVNLNALGNVGQVNQPVQVRDVKDAAQKGDFEKVIKGKVSASNSSDRLKVEETIKQPAKRTEVKNEGMSKAKSLDQQKETKAPKKESDIQEAAEEIMAGAAQILNITPEELKAAMDTLELQVGDLADRNNVAQLVLLLNGSEDISDMLVDNGMLEVFNELNDFIADTLENQDIKPEDFKSLLETLGTEQIPEEIKPVDEPKAQKPDTELKTDIDQDRDSAFVQTETKEPQIIVEDNRETSDNGNFLESEKTEEAPKADIKDSQPITAAESFVRNLEMAVEETGEVVETQTDVREIVYQVVQRIRVQLNPDSSNLEMRLNPENLGRVSINITSRAGVLTAQINTENRQAKEAIESQLQILKENIEAKGIKVEAVEVRISDFNLADSRNSESNADDGSANSGRGSRRNNGLFADDGSDDAMNTESSETEILDPASTVSYRA